MRRLILLCAVLGSLTLTAGTVVRSKSNISNNRMAPSAYVVVRPLFEKADAKHTATATMFSKKTFYFDPAEKLVDLSDVDLTKVRVQPGTGGQYVVVLSLKKPIVGNRIGVFLDGKLVAALMTKSPLEMMAVENSFSQAEANKVAGRIRRGGAE